MPADAAGRGYCDGPRGFTNAFACPARGHLNQFYYAGHAPGWRGGDHGHTLARHGRREPSHMARGLTRGPGGQAIGGAHVESAPPGPAGTETPDDQTGMLLGRGKKCRLESRFDPVHHRSGPAGTGLHKEELSAGAVDIAALDGTMTKAESHRWMAMTVLRAFARCPPGQRGSRQGVPTEAGSWAGPGPGVLSTLEVRSAGWGRRSNLLRQRHLRAGRGVFVFLYESRPPPGPHDAKRRRTAGRRETPGYASWAGSGRVYQSTLDQPRDALAGWSSPGAQT